MTISFLNKGHLSGSTSSSQMFTLHCDAAVCFSDSLFYCFHRTSLSGPITVYLRSHYEHAGACDRAHTCRLAAQCSCVVVVFFFLACGVFKCAAASVRSPMSLAKPAFQQPSSAGAVKRKGPACRTKALIFWLYSALLSR